MNDKERIQKIKENISFLKESVEKYDNVHLTPKFFEDMEWLIGKTELAIRAEEIAKQALEQEDEAEKIDEGIITYRASGKLKKKYGI
jgi:hypothetical protein